MSEARVGQPRRLNAEREGAVAQGTRRWGRGWRLLCHPPG